MITYVALMSFTDKGIASIKDSTRRAAAVKEAATKFGVRFRELCWTMGAYDLVAVLEGDSEQALTAFALAVAAQGNVRTQSMRAFSAAEMDAILAKLP